MFAARSRPNGQIGCGLWGLLLAPAEKRTPHSPDITRLSAPHNKGDVLRCAFSRISFTQSYPFSCLSFLSFFLSFLSFCSPFLQLCGATFAEKFIEAQNRSCIKGIWRNGSASDSRSEGWELESLCPHSIISLSLVILS